MGSFVKSDQVIRDLLNTLDKNTTTAQQLKEALLRESNCNYTQQIVSSLNSGIGDLPDAVRSLKQDTGTTELKSAKRYFLNDKATPINTTKLKYAFPYDNTGNSHYTFPLHQMQSRDLITSYKSLDPAYTLSPTGEIRNNNDFTYIVNVNLSMTVYDGYTALGEVHSSPSFTVINNPTVYDIFSMESPFSTLGLELEFIPYIPNDQFIEQKYGGIVNYVHGHTIAGFKKIEMQGSYVIAFVRNSDNGFNLTRFGLVLGPACCDFNGRQQHVGFFKQLPAGSKFIDSSNYIDVICLGNQGT